MLWPFASTSIWNVPIGDGAQLVPAHIAASEQIGNFAEEEVIVLEPDAPMVDLLASHATGTRAVTGACRSRVASSSTACPSRRGS